MPHRGGVCSRSRRGGRAGTSFVGLLQGFVLSVASWKLPVRSMASVCFRHDRLLLSLFLRSFCAFFVACLIFSFRHAHRQCRSSLLRLVGECGRATFASAHAPAWRTRVPCLPRTQIRVPENIIRRSGEPPSMSFQISLVFVFCRFPRLYFCMFLQEGRRGIFIAVAILHSFDISGEFRGGRKERTG